MDGIWSEGIWAIIIAGYGLALVFAVPQIVRDARRRRAARGDE